MPGQQQLLNFLQQPAPGKAQNTALLTPAIGQKPTPRQAQALNQQRQAVKDAAAAQRLQLAQQRVDLRASQEQRLKTGQDIRTIGRSAGIVGGGISTVTDRLSGIGDRFETWADSVPKPGGIVLLIGIIFLFLWAIVPVNGKHTRAELLWLTLNGRTTMASAPEAGTGSGGVGSGGSDYTGNGHDTSTTMGILAQLPIRDWGGIP